MQQHPKTRGVGDILIFVADGLKGMWEGLAAVFLAATLHAALRRPPDPQQQDYASWKDRRAPDAAIRPIYTAPSAEAAQANLDAFADGPWGLICSMASAAWRNAWDRVIPRVRASCAQGDLHDERHKEHQHATTQYHQDPRLLPERRSLSGWGRASQPVGVVLPMTGSKP